VDIGFASLTGCSIVCFNYEFGGAAMAGLHEGGTVGSMLITAIVRYAERPAIADERTRWTYRELGENVGRSISLFRSLGLKKGGAVSVLSTNRVEAWAVVTAAAVMGLRYTPLHPLAA